MHVNYIASYAKSSPELRNVRYKEYINSIPKQQRIHPKFTNKVPLHPVQSGKVLNQVLRDLVDLSASPSITDTPGVTYKYVLVVLDVFSRFCFLRPLRSKSSNEVAQSLIEIFSDTGSPARTQSDQRMCKDADDGHGGKNHL